MRKVEIKIINTFNMYRVPFVAGIFTLCMSVFFKKTLPIHLRLMPLLTLGTFATLFNFQIGQYGLYRNIDNIIEVLTDKPETLAG